MGPVVEGTVVPNGARVPGTPYELDPIRAAFNIGTAIRWLDYNGESGLNCLSYAVLKYDASQTAGCAFILCLRKTHS